MIALDLINTPFLDQVGARRAAIRYLANSINQDAIFELVSIDGNGMHVLHDFTSDTKVLVTALKKVASQLDAMTDAKCEISSYKHLSFLILSGYALVLTCNSNGRLRLNDA